MLLQVMEVRWTNRKTGQRKNTVSIDAKSVKLEMGFAIAPSTSTNSPSNSSSQALFMFIACTWYMCDILSG